MLCRLNGQAASMRSRQASCAYRRSKEHLKLSKVYNGGASERGIMPTDYTHPQYQASISS